MYIEQEMTLYFTIVRILCRGNLLDRTVISYFFKNYTFKRVVFLKGLVTPFYRESP